MSIVGSLDWKDPLEGRHSNPLQYSCLENPMGRGAWLAIVHGVAKSWASLTKHSTQHRGFKVQQQLFLFFFSKKVL